MTFEQLWDQYAPYVVTAVRAKVPRCDREDVVQDIAVRLWRSLPRYDHTRAALTTWMSTIIRNSITDHLRRARRRYATEALVETSCIDRPRSDHADYARLARYDPEVADLLYGRGLTMRQAAAALGCAIGTIKSRNYMLVHRMRRPWTYSPRRRRRKIRAD